MISNLIVEIRYLSVDSFDSAVGFHYKVWYGQERFGVELLHICHSVVYLADGSEITHISISGISRMRAKILDVII